jgi:hypothetical protein
MYTVFWSRRRVSAVLLMDFSSRGQTTINANVYSETLKNSVMQKRISGEVCIAVILFSSTIISAHTQKM